MQAHAAAPTRGGRRGLASPSQGGRAVGSLVLRAGPPRGYPGRDAQGGGVYPKAPGGTGCAGACPQPGSPGDARHSGSARPGIPSPVPQIPLQSHKPRGVRPRAWRWEAGRPLDMGGPKGPATPRTALPASRPPGRRGHSTLLCLTGAVSAAKLSAAVCKPPPAAACQAPTAPACLAGGSHKLPGLAPGRPPAPSELATSPGLLSPHVPVLSRAVSPQPPWQLLGPLRCRRRWGTPGSQTPPGDLSNFGR